MRNGLLEAYPPLIQLQQDLKDLQMLEHELQILFGEGEKSQNIIYQNISVRFI